MDSIKERLECLKNYIDCAAKKTNRAAKDIRVVCVTKYAQLEDVIKAVKYGCYEIGENRQQELSKKYDALKNSVSSDEFKKIKWHFIGHLQTNKIKGVLRTASMIQSVDSLRLVEAINEQAKKIDKKIDVLVQVKISPEETKFGIGFKDIGSFLKQAIKYPQLRIRGLMGIGVFSDKPQDSRAGFRNLKAAFNEANEFFARQGNPDMDILSMGMSNDFQVAIEEGSNMIRVGSVIFGG